LIPLRNRQGLQLRLKKFKIKGVILMIVTSAVGKIDALIGRFEAPILAYMEKEEGDFAKNSLKTKLYNVKTSKSYAEAVAGMVGIGDMVATDGAVPYDELEETYTKTFTHQVFKKGIEIKRETMEDAKIIDMENQSGTITDAAGRTKEKFVHAPFGYCTATTFTLAGKSFTNVGADGLALVTASHTSHTGKAGTQSNFVNSPFSIDTLKTAEEAFRAVRTEAGEKSNVKPNLIFAPYALRNEVYEILNSGGKLNTGNNNTNPYEQKYEVIISDWLDELSNTTKVFLIDSAYMKKCLFWIDRVPLEIKSEKDFNTDNWRIKAYERFSLGWTDWRWCVGIGT
jgi:hypothetical protein